MRKLLPYIFKYKGLIFLTILFTLVKVISDLMLPTIMANIVDVGIANNDINYILMLGTLMIIIAIVGGIFSLSSNYFASKASVNITTDLRTILFDKSINLSFRQINEFGTSSIITRTTNDITQIQNVLGVGFRLIFFAPFMFISTLIIALVKDASLTLVIMIGTAILALVMVVILKFAIPLFKKNQEVLDKLNLVVRERLTGIRVIRAFDTATFEKDKFKKTSEELKKILVKVSRIMATLSPSIQLMFSLLSIAIVWFGAIRIDSGNMQVGELIAFLQYGSQLMFSILMLVMVFMFVPRAEISIARVMEVLEVKEELQEGSLNKSNGKGEVEFKDVTFYYGKEIRDIEPAIDGLSVTFKSGKYNAIIGSTGSGKSTVVKLVERFYDVYRGAILINNINVKDYTNEAIRSLISISPQKTEILTGTVRDNVDINHVLSDEEVIKALMISDAYEFVKEYDDGINHELNRSGTNLSGGQKQRISIARAVAKKSEIYIFDDSFSALDSTTEERVKKAIFEHLKDKTIIVIAQKINSIKQADNILVMSNGELVDSGSHSELSVRCDVYKEIIESQEGGEHYE